VCRHLKLKVQRKKNVDTETIEKTPKVWEMYKRWRLYESLATGKFVEDRFNDLGIVFSG